MAQLSLNYLGLAVEGGALEPLRATLELYADRGDPALARHARALAGVDGAPGGRAAADRRADVLRPRHRGDARDRRGACSPATARCCCSALLARLFARYAAVNAFVQTRTRLLHSHEEVPWPITLGNRSLV